jgi:hypothetical protein
VPGMALMAASCSGVWSREIPKEIAVRANA